MTAGEVVVSGFGVYTGFGYGADRLRAGILTGPPAFAPVTRFDTTGFRVTHAACGPAGPDQRSVLVECGRAALDMARLAPSRTIPLLVGTKGDYRTITAYWAAAAAGEAVAEDLGDGVPGLLVARAAAALGLGRAVAFTNACVASANAIAHGALLVRSGMADAVVCGGAYLVDREVFAKFDAVRALATDGTVRPFARNRTGVLLGDGVAVLVLESAAHAAARAVPPLARLTGWAMSNDAHHVVHPHPQGRGLAAAISTALGRANLAPEQVDYVNAHGTGTILNDVSEVAALRTAFGGHAARLPVSSTKSATGHALEASAAVELVACLTAMAAGTAPPTWGCHEPDPRCAVDCVPNEPRKLRLDRVLSVNSSFGGVNSALVLERP